MRDAPARAPVRALRPDACSRPTACSASPQAIAASERGHTGEICFAVEPRAASARRCWRGMQARAARAARSSRSCACGTRAANNGVLLYLLLADHRIEIVADRGFDGAGQRRAWRGVCQLIEERLQAGEPEAGGAARRRGDLSALLAEHFPRDRRRRRLNELPDDPHTARKANRAVARIERPSLSGTIRASPAAPNPHA